jgi:hypothetical protein
VQFEARLRIWSLRFGENRDLNDGIHRREMPEVTLSVQVPSHRHASTMTRASAATPAPGPLAPSAARPGWS